MFRADQGRKRIEGLSEKQMEVLRLGGEGLDSEEMAARLHRSVHTVISHRALIFAKLGARNMSNAVHIAHQRGLLT